MSDLNPLGVAGNASAATAEKGEKLISHSVNGLVELLEDINSFDMAQLADG
jgi:creatinine amidohydrolase